MHMHYALTLIVDKYDKYTLYAARDLFCTLAPPHPHPPDLAPFRPSRGRGPPPPPQYTHTHTYDTHTHEYTHMTTPHTPVVQSPVPTPPSPTRLAKKLHRHHASCGVNYRIRTADYSRPGGTLALQPRRALRQTSNGLRVLIERALSAAPQRASSQQAKRRNSSIAHCALAEPLRAASAWRNCSTASLVAC